MRTKQVLAIFLILLSGFFYYMWVDSFDALGNQVFVTRVVDGDTLILDNQEKIRLLGINTPEKNTLGYSEAKIFLQNIAENKTIQVEITETDKYGRLLAYAFINSININNEILKNGLATLYYYEEDGYFNQLKKAESEARQQELGLWKKSPDFQCLKLIKLEYLDNETQNETLIFENICNKPLNITFKDDATHIYKEILQPGNTTFHFKDIFNDDKDSLYVWDNNGLMLFYRYG